MNAFQVDQAIRRGMPFSAIVDINGVHNPRTGGFHVVQDAIDAGHNSIFVRDGTYPGFNWPDGRIGGTLVCESRNTIIDGAEASNAADIEGDFFTIRGGLWRTTGGGVGNFDVILMAATADDTRIIDVEIDDSDRYGISITAGANRNHIRGCRIAGCDSEGIYNNGGVGTNIVGNIILNVGTEGIQQAGSGDDTCIIGNYITGSGGYGILIDATSENCVVVGNRVTGNTSGEIQDNSGTSTVTGNDTT